MLWPHCLGAISILVCCITSELGRKENKISSWHLGQMKTQINGAGEFTQGWKEGYCKLSNNFSRKCQKTQANCQAGIWRKWIHWLLLSWQIVKYFKEMILWAHKLERKKKKNNWGLLLMTLSWKGYQKSKKANKIFGM
jgi:hypothetical protein